MATVCRECFKRIVVITKVGNRQWRFQQSASHRCVCWLSHHVWLWLRGSKQAKFNRQTNRSSWRWFKNLREHLQPCFFVHGVFPLKMNMSSKCPFNPMKLRSLSCLANWNSNSVQNHWKVRSKPKHTVPNPPKSGCYLNIRPLWSCMHVCIIVQ